MKPDAMAKNKDNIRTDPELFRDLINKSNDAIFVADPSTGLFVFVNDKACATLGYDRRELLKMGVMDIETSFPDDFLWQTHLNELRQKGSLIFEGIHKRKNGTTFPVEANISYVVQNTREYLVTVVRDITERKGAEGALQLQGEIAANISEGIYLVSANDLRIVYANPRMEEIFGYDPGEMNGKHVSIINAPTAGDPEKTAGQIEKALRETGRWTGEVYNVRKDGTPFWGHASISMLQHPQYGEVYVSLQSDVTERKRAEAALKAREKQLAESQRIAHVGSWEHNLKTGNVFWSDELFRLFGLVPGTDPADINMFFEMVHPDDKAILKKAIDETLRDKKPYSIDYRFNVKNGTTRIFHAQAELVPDEAGDPVILTGTAQDITERKQAERERERYFKLFQNSSDFMVIADPKGAFIKVNPACVQKLGYSEDELAAKPFIDFIHPDDRQSTLDEMERQLRRGFSLNFENRYLCNDGSLLWLSWRASYNKADGLTYATARDITGLKKAEAEREQYFRFFDYSNDLMCIAGLDGHFKVVNPAWKALLGYTEEELLQLPFTEFIHPDDVELTLKKVKEQIAGNYTENFINRYRCKDGSYRWLEWQGPPAKDNVLFAIARDITARKDAEEKIRQSEEFIRSILNSVDEGFIVIDRDFLILTANKTYCDQVGRCDEEITGRHCYEVSHRTSRPCYEEGEECVVRQVLADGQPHAAIHRHMDGDGRLLFVETKGYPIKDASGNVTSVIETINNITEKHLLEEERLKTQKLESIGTLAGGIAHDFNNLLQGIFGYISMAKMSLDRREMSLSMLEQAERALQQSVSLTSQLLTFSKGGKPVKKRLSLPPVIENAAKFALSGSRSEYRLDIETGLWQVDADGGQLGQVIQNIVLNADQAMPEGGIVVITAKNVVGPDKDNAQLPKGNRVEISVRDSGIGIPEKYLLKIFDPYFTTKEKGSGLGLATSYSIIRSHGGLIDVVSEPGKGTTFFIYLPAAEAHDEIKETVPFSSSSVATGKVLVMDDEEVVRMVAGQFLRSLNHEVAFAENGEAALKEYRDAKAKGRPFDIVILDLTVRGGMGGKETIQRLLAIDPDVKAIVSSGYSDDAAVADYRKYGFMACLTKPYKLEDLRHVLNALLSE
jgi:PAS domain S-box-containing protein